MAFFTSTARCFDVLSDPLMAQAVRVLPGPRGLGTKQLTKSYGTVFHRGPDRIPMAKPFRSDLRRFLFTLWATATICAGGLHPLRPVFDSHLAVDRDAPTDTS